MSRDCCPAVSNSSGARSLAQPLWTRPSILKELINARRPRTFLGGSQDAEAAMRCGEAWIEPRDHIQPRIVVEAGQTMVFSADRRRLQRSRAEKVFRQFKRSSCGVFPPQYKSSAILATHPFRRRSLRTRRINSSSAVFEPGIPMAQRV